MNELSLHIPSYDELWYRQKLMQDPDTMSYNKGYPLNADGYHPETGCIAFPKQEWDNWYDYFVGQEPQRFYAYIMRKTDGVFIGEVNIHKNPDTSWYNMGIVLEAPYRGKGYSTEALELLLQHAFERMGAEAVRNDFGRERISALRAHQTVGFTILSEENGIMELQITREQYFRKKKNPKRIVAIVCLALILLSYLASFAVSLSDSSKSGELFQACLIATVFLPILCWIYIWLYGQVRQKHTIADLDILQTGTDGDERQSGF